MRDWKRKAGFRERSGAGVSGCESTRPPNELALGGDGGQAWLFSNRDMRTLIVAELDFSAYQVHI